MNKEYGIKRLNRLSAQAKEYRDEDTRVVKLSTAIEIIELLDEPKPLTEDRAWKVIADVYNQDADRWKDAKNHYLNSLKEPEITEHEAWEIIMREHHYHISPSYVEEYKKAIQDGVIPSNLNKTKPIVPQFVADWIEASKKGNYNLYQAFANAPIDVGAWIFKEDDSNSIFARAWLDGYEVEKEKKYQVIIPNVFEHLTLIGDPGHFYFENRTGINEARRDAIQLTENEIKESFSWAWQFAEEVSE